MCSVKGLQSQSFQEPQSQGATFTTGCQNWPLYHSAATQCLSLIHSTIVLIKVMNGSHKNFNQNYNSFQIFSSRKLEADLRSNGLKEINKKTCICLEPFPPAGLSLPHPQELGGWQTPKTADHREAPWASKERGKIRKENRQHLPQPYYNSQ